MHVFGSFSKEQKLEASTRLPAAFKHHFHCDGDDMWCLGLSNGGPCIFAPSKIEGRALTVYPNVRCFLCDDQQLRAVCNTPAGRQYVASNLRTMAPLVRDVAVVRRLSTIVARKWMTGGLQRQSWLSEELIISKSDHDLVALQASASCDRGFKYQKITDDRRKFRIRDAWAIHDADKVITENSFQSQMRIARTSSDARAMRSEITGLDDGDDTTSFRKTPKVVEEERVPLLFRSTSPVEVADNSSDVFGPATRSQVLAAEFPTWTPTAIFSFELEFIVFKERSNFNDGLIPYRDSLNDLLRMIPYLERERLEVPVVLDQMNSVIDGNTEIHCLELMIADAKRTQLQRFISLTGLSHWASVNSDNYKDYGLLRALHSGGYDFKTANDNLDLLLNDDDVFILGNDDVSMLIAFQKEFLKLYTDEVRAMEFFDHAMTFLTSCAAKEPTVEEIMLYLSLLEDPLRRAMGMCEGSHWSLCPMNTNLDNWRVDVSQCSMFAYLSYQAHHVLNL